MTDSGEGVEIDVKNITECQRIVMDFHTQCGDIENIWLKIKIGQHKTLIGVIYKAPSGPYL